MAALSLVLAVILAAPAGASGPAPRARTRHELDRVVAVVGDQVVLLSELTRATSRHPALAEALAGLPNDASESAREEAHRNAQAMVLDELVDLELFRAEAEKFEIPISEEDVDKALPNVAAQSGLTVDELRKRVEESEDYESWAEFRSDVRNQIIMYIVPQHLATWSVSEAQVREHYRKMTKDESAKVAVRQFMFSAGSLRSADRDRAFARAQLVARRLRAGEKAEDIATSIEYRTELERTIGRGDIAPALEDAVFAAKQGAVVGPLASGQGYVVFQVEEHQEGAALSYEEVRDRIRDQLEQEAFFRAEQELRKKLRAKAHVDIRL